jgi:hypothetical protein
MQEQRIATELCLIRLLLEHFLEVKDPVEYTRYVAQKQEFL